MNTLQSSKLPWLTIDGIETCTIRKPTTPGVRIIMSFDYPAVSPVELSDLILAASRALNEVRGRKNPYQNQPRETRFSNS